jgi:hypothetical protein
MIPLGWIPVIGPIIDGIFGYLNKKQDTAVEIRKVEGSERIAELNQSKSILETFSTNIFINMCRDIVVFPVCVMTALVVWDYIVAIPYPNLIWGIKAIPDGSGFSWLPQSVMVFLLGNTYLNNKQK